MYATIEQIDNPTDNKVSDTVNNNNNNNNDSTFSLESFFANLPKDEKERKQVMAQFKNTLKQERARLKELKRGDKKFEKQGRREQRQNEKKERNQKQNKCGSGAAKNIENKIERLNRKKYLLIAKAQYIDSKIAILSKKNQMQSTDTPSTTSPAVTQSQQPIDNSC